METKENKDKIIETLQEKSQIKQLVYENTYNTFRIFKDTLEELVLEFKQNLKDSDTDIVLDYHDRGEFEAELKVAGDLLIFIMHTNVFEFPRDHAVWKTSYLQNNRMASYAGIINIYNFLADSFKYNRIEDLGYLIARTFINRDMFYFVEGKRQLGFLYNNFGQEKLSQQNIRKIIESAILYSLDFDLLVPPYDNVKIATVSQIQEKYIHHRMRTGKRLGFKFYADTDAVEPEQTN